MIDKPNHANQPADRSENQPRQGIDLTTRARTSQPPPTPPTADPQPATLNHGLLACSRCRSKLMYPADCQEHGRDHWHIELTCPDCGDHHWVLCDIDMLDTLDRELDQAEAEIEADLASLTRANMYDYLTRFVHALNAGAIQPDDFTA